MTIQGAYELIASVILWISEFQVNLASNLLGYEPTMPVSLVKSEEE